ncbi:MAG: S-layer family protein [Symploca sp. SIO3C6]|nr:S-layer family protein [Symploca sp. SIO3C6]
MGGFFHKTLWLLSSFFLCLISTTNAARTQITPDTTLPNNTVVIPEGNILRIEEGTKAGTNLFHSFEEFSVLSGSQAFFNNSTDIGNIISRVTGSQVSNIDGLIRANGTANLFFINPNGIIFGPDAQLNIGGSFIASTANSLKLADGSDFSATQPQAPPLLAINVPIGLQFGSVQASNGQNSGSIVNRSQASSLVPLPPLTPQIPSNVGLEVLPGQTIALLGRDIFLEGGNLTAFQGQIELGSIADSGFVSFTPTPTGVVLGYEGIENFGNIELSGIASVNTIGLGGGTIRLVGDTVNLREVSSLLADTIGDFDGSGIEIQAAQFQLQDLAFISAGTAGTGAGGGITIDATQSVELSGIGFENFLTTYISAALAGTLNPLTRESGLFTGTIGTGTAGNITINTQQLRLSEGAIVFSPTFSQGSGGNLEIIASDYVEVLGSGLVTATNNIGNAGKITIDTGKLTIQDGAVVLTSTLGGGDGGDIQVSASELVEVSKTREDSPIATTIATSSIGGNGRAGNLEIDTQSLLLTGGGAIITSSGVLTRDEVIFGGGPGGDLTIKASDSVKVSGLSEENEFRSILTTAAGSSEPAGDLRIETKRLIIEDGATVTAATGAEGSGGNIFVEASEAVEVIGTSEDGLSPSILSASSGDRFAQLFFPGIIPTGAAGSVIVSTKDFIVRDGASVNVTSLGLGDAGTLAVIAENIELDNSGSITADTKSGTGGNITLQVQELLQMNSNSRISTDAGSADGGNITIDTEILVAQGNSDITANAQQGAGGRVQINAAGIFGIEFREQLTSEDDITATSELGPEFSGIVEINTPDIDPKRGLVELPENIIDTTKLIATGCAANQGNSFVVTGRGGLPQNPIATLRSQTVWQDLRLGSNSTTQELPTEISTENLYPSTNQIPPIVEAQGWLIDAKGNVELVADNAVSNNSWGRVSRNFKCAN